jgi:hypothetical protein
VPHPPTTPDDAMPTSGFLRPLFPSSWFRHGLVAGALFSSLDRYLNMLRVRVGVATRALFEIDYAQGPWLDKLAAWVGVASIAGDSDDDQRKHILATMEHGKDAVSKFGLQDFLAALTNVPVTITDGPPGSASYVITVTGNPSNLDLVLASCRSTKPIGYVFILRVYLPLTDGGGGRLGEFRLGEAPLGGAGSFVTIGS